eukprot:3886006-Pyramimonas_sp.AAC.1
MILIIALTGHDHGDDDDEDDDGTVVETGKSCPCRLRSLKSSWGGHRGKCPSWQKLSSNRAR